MHRFFKNRKGQSTLEYAILIIIIIGALLSLQIYIKRGIQGRLKSSADDIGDQFSAGNTNVVRKTFTNSRTVDTKTNGIQRTTLDRNEITAESLSSNIINADDEYWGN